ncbi:hypothetical protein CEXT_131241 [Caerostris extrusa]|uniref:Uncharacterized protein n=1 Tax=Caerostris extrusa TaxID=172846 RepID=A0AAV4N4E3_CAEEX|nr:hypothetical protein CEXT_131241 [Caerostris extrusa]
MGSTDTQKNLCNNAKGQQLRRQIVYKKYLNDSVESNKSNQIVRTQPRSCMSCRILPAEVGAVADMPSPQMGSTDTQKKLCNNASFASPKGQQLRRQIVYKKYLNDSVESNKSNQIDRTLPRCCMSCRILQQRLGLSLTWSGCTRAIRPAYSFILLLFVGRH